VRALLSLIVLVTTLVARAADDPVNAAMKLYDKRRYEQAARLMEDARFDGERSAQAQLVLGMIYLRKADLHEAFARTAAAAEIDYLDKLTKAAGEARSRYARLYLAEAHLARGNAREAAQHFERVRADSGVERNHRAIAAIGLGSALWMQRDVERARKLWAGAKDSLEVRLALAAAQGRARAVDPKAFRELADTAAGEKNLSLRARRYLMEIYLAAGAPEQALAVARAAELGGPSYVERFKVSEGTAKTIAFYDLALLGDLAQLYRELARRRFEQAAADPRVKPTAEYYLAEALSGLGENDAAAAAAQAFLTRPQAPAQYRSRAQARLALIAYRQGKKEEGERALAGMAESNDAEVLAAAVLACASAGAQCSKVLARASQVAEAGDVRRTQRLGFALGTYYLGRHDYARAIGFMESGRDKSHKNKIEANDPEMLALLAEAYYRTKKFSEGLEIFFEMSQEFAVVRQIQEAMQAVYSMEQRSAGDVRIL
jgi:tetratricopeptide (TPR) repeat protein